LAHPTVKPDEDDLLLPLPQVFTDGRVQQAAKHAARSSSDACSDSAEESAARQAMIGAIAKGMMAHKRVVYQ
jgi:hypothetical protein